MGAQTDLGAYKKSLQDWALNLGPLIGYLIVEIPPSSFLKRVGMPDFLLS